MSLYSGHLQSSFLPSIEESSVNFLNAEDELQTEQQLIKDIGGDDDKWMTPKKNQFSKMSAEKMIQENIAIREDSAKKLQQAIEKNDIEALLDYNYGQHQLENLTNEMDAKRIPNPFGHVVKFVDMPKFIKKVESLEPETAPKKESVKDVIERWKGKARFKESSSEEEEEKEEGSQPSSPEKSPEKKIENKSKGIPITGVNFKITYGNKGKELKSNDEIVSYRIKASNAPKALSELELIYRDRNMYGLTDDTSKQLKEWIDAQKSAVAASTRSKAKKK